tara:strand:+ start:637 stop:1581 length:945 start_codon:yes stop_codon:yes gene_type:complete
MKSFLKKILVFFLKFENKKIKKIISKEALKNFHLLDVGAAGNINNKWDMIKDKIIISLIEPHKQSASKLREKGFQVVDKFLFSEKNLNLTFYQTKKPTNSGLLKPNLKYLNKFPDPERFTIENELKIKTSTIDHEFSQIQNPDFIKIDTEGAELEILKGSENTLKKVLGLEIECNFFELREKSATFEQVANYLKKFNFVFIDFINIIRWEKTHHRFTGQPQFADVLFLKDPNEILEKISNNKIDEKEFFNYLVILTIYNRSDILKMMLDHANSDQEKKYHLKELYNLVEKKQKKANFLLKYSHNFTNIIYNVYK